MRVGCTNAGASDAVGSAFSAVVGRLDIEAVGLATALDLDLARLPSAKDSRVAIRGMWWADFLDRRCRRFRGGGCAGGVGSARGPATVGATGCPEVGCAAAGPAGDGTPDFGGIHSAIPAGASGV